MDFGEERTLDKFENGKPVVKHKWVKVKELTKDDSEELAKIIQFQREHKDSKEVTFRRIYSDKGHRFLEREYRL